MAPMLLWSADICRRQNHKEPILAAALAAALCGSIAAPSVAHAEPAPAAAAPAKPKPKPTTPAGAPMVTVTVTNAEGRPRPAAGGRARLGKLEDVLGASKAGKQATAQVPRSYIVAWTCTGPSPTVSRWMRPTSTSARKRRST